MVFGFWGVGLVLFCFLLLLPYFGFGGFVRMCGLDFSRF